MKKTLVCLAAVLGAATGKAQDNCLSATSLCANNMIASTTFGATASGTDPVLSCGDGVVNNNVWYTLTASSTGTCTLTVAQINNTPGLEMEVFTGACGSLVSTGVCDSANGPNGSMTVTFGVVAGTTYHVMVDGSSGNQEAFTILATSATNSIIGRPQPQFLPTTFSGCAPLSVLLQNTSTILGGTNITYQWRLDGGLYVNATGNDTTVVFATTGSHTVDLKVCNAECGCASTTQFIEVEMLVASMTFPPSICQDEPASFSGTAEYLPDPPYTPVNIVSWDWNFGDPGSGNNTANGQNVQHAFSDSGSFVVTLVVTSADCGTDTITDTVNVNQRPFVNAGPDVYICELETALLSSSITNATFPVTLQWSGSGTFSCDTCSSTSVSGLAAGGPYPMTVQITDANGCMADTTVDVIVNAIPVTTLGNDTTVCPFTALQLNANMLAGSPPFIYSWTPTAGLSDSTIQNPTVVVTSPLNYCVTVEDSIGCSSVASCIAIDVYPQPNISAAPGVLCATDPNPQTTLTVNGGSPGSTYSWTLSPNYSLITGANVDSSSIDITFPTGVAATYNFTCIVTDGLTGCTDTAYSSYQVVAGLNMSVNIPSSACIGNPVLLTASGAVTYSWSANPAYPFADSTLANQTVSPAVTTTFTVTGTAGTCSQAISGTVTMHPRPNVTASNDTTVCPGTALQLFSNPSGGTAPYTFAWSPAAGLSSSTTQNPIATVNAPAAFCVIATDSFGCPSDSDCVSVDVFPPPAVSASPTSLCATTPNPQSTFSVSGAAPGSSYGWGGSADYFLITSANGDSSSVTITPPSNVTGTYSFTVQVTDAVTGCVTTLNQSFTMTTGLNMNVIGPSSLCEGESGTLIVTGAATYVWSASPSYPFADSTSAIQDLSLTTTTVFTITGDLLGCTQIITDTLTINPNPDAVASPIPLFCGCTTATLNGIMSTPGMLYNWTSTAGNTVSNANQVTASSFICGSDSFVLIVTDPSTGCADTAAAIATQNPLPDVLVVSSPTYICEATPSTILLDGNGSNADPGTTYLWTSNNPSAIFADSTALVTTATISTATVFYLTVTDSLGCQNTIADTIHTYPVPVVAAINPYICTSDPVLEATISITGASPGSTYLWDTIPGCVTPNVANTSSQLFDFTTCGPGIYLFSVEVTDAITGCILRVSQTVTVVSGVTLTVSPDLILCEGDSATLTASGANSFAWAPTGDTTASITVGGLTAAGSPYAFIVTGTINTCNASDTINVTVNPTPQTSAISGPQMVCDSTPGQVYNVTPVAGNYTWTISNGTIVSGQGTSTLTVNWDSAGSGTLTVVDTNAFGCAGTPQSITVTINPLPVTSAVSGPDSVCENSFATYQVAQNAGSTYFWSITNGTIIGNNNAHIVNVQWGSSGSGTLEVYETNAVGCDGSPVQMTINIFPVPSLPAIQGSFSVCAGDTMQVYSTPLIGGATYAWTVTGGSLTGGQGTDSITVNWDTTGTGSLSVIVTNQYGCASPNGNVSVTINPLPVATATPDSATLCRNAPLPISGTTNFGTIHWTTSGNGTFSDTTTASTVYFPGSTDSGNVVLTMVLSSLTCGDDTATVVLNVVPAPNAVITSVPDTICWGSTASLTASGGTSYTWLNNGAVTASIFVSPTVDSTFTVVANNGFNCPDTTSFTLHVIPPGIPDAGQDQVSCIGDTVQLNGSVMNAGQMYWNTLGDGTFSDSTLQSTSYFPGTSDTTNGFTYLVAYSSGACINLTDTLLINFSHDPWVITRGDTTISDNNGVSIPLSTSSGNGTSVLFTTSGTGTFNPNDSDLTGVYIPSSDDYALDSVIITVTVSGPCGTVTDYFVIDFSAIVIPNVFTPFPGTPGYNDFFEVRNLPPGSKIKIWDRWGLLVFTSDDYKNDWDARELEADVFYYILETRQKNYHGWIRVIRDEKK